MKHAQDLFSGIYMLCWTLIVPYSYDKYGCIRRKHWIIFELDIPHWNHWGQIHWDLFHWFQWEWSAVSRGLEASHSTSKRAETLCRITNPSKTKWWHLEAAEASKPFYRGAPLIETSLSVSHFLHLKLSLVKTYLMKTKEHALIEAFFLKEQSLYLLFIAWFCSSMKCIYSFLITIYLPLWMWYRIRWAEFLSLFLSPTPEFHHYRGKKTTTCGSQEQLCENFSFFLKNCCPCFYITDTSLPPHKDPWQYSGKHTII